MEIILNLLTRGTYGIFLRKWGKGLKVFETFAKSSLCYGSDSVA